MKKIEIHDKQIKRRFGRVQTTPNSFCHHPSHEEDSDSKVKFMRGIIRLPIGQDPERDTLIKQAWGRTS